MSTDHSTANGAYAPGGALAGPARAWTKDGIMACPTSRLVRNLRAHCATLGLACTSSRVLLACLKVTGRGVPPVLALVADRRFFVRAV